jgi:transposase
MKPFSIDLRQRILDAYDAGEGTRLQIAKRFSVSLGFVKKILAQRKATGSIAPIPRPGRPPVFSGDVLKRLEDFVSRNPDATLAEIQDHFSDEVECSVVTIHKTLKRHQYRFKKNAESQ